MNKIIFVFCFDFVFGSLQRYLINVGLYDLLFVNCKGFNSLLSMNFKWKYFKLLNTIYVEIIIRGKIGQKYNKMSQLWKIKIKLFTSNNCCLMKS